jgi:MFS superfamily sulfate permease-like transporter
MFFIMIAILTVMHHIFVGVLAGIFWTLAYVFGIQVGRIEIWEIVLGLRREEKIGEVMGIVEESKENIAHQTYRNHIENLIFTEPS